nr:immune inhibitor A domain-containing protein [Streptomyces sp. SID4926]
MFRQARPEPASGEDSAQVSRQRRALRAAAVTVATGLIGATAASFGVAQAADGQVSGKDGQKIERRDPALGKKGAEHNLEGPFSEKQDAQRQEALNQLLTGRKKTTERDGSKVLKLDKGKYVELGREKTDKIFTILVEFGDDVDPSYGGQPGPLHNQIAKPDAKNDNSTDWQADFNQKHYQDLYFSDSKDDNVQSLKKYYEKQSSGRYSVDGEVTDWVKVKSNEARYGNNKCGASTCSTVWDLVRDGVTQWVSDQKAAGKSAADIKADLAQYDQWDRYDFDGDGDFNEPDGYIDHFQIVHAGEDESAGGGVQGTDAIWAHRWYAYGTDQGRTGPAENKAGGTQIGDTGIWVGDYTMQPENGGLGVFAHEYGHDLGLPDLYDTTNTGDNSVAYWSLMSSGSWLGRGKNAIGDLPGDMNAWDKLQLGWLNYGTANAAKSSTTKLGVAEYNTKDKQGLVVNLPDKEVTTTIVKPASGATQWWSGSGDNLNNTLTRSVDLTGKSAASLDLKGWWDIEAEYDFLYAEASTDGGANWEPLDGTANGKALPRDGSDKPALTGPSDAYQDLSYPLDAYAGKKIDIRFRYLTDGGLAKKGFTADDIKVVADGSELLSDDVENGDNGWTAKGFSRVGESFTKDYAQYYIAENRQYVSYDTTLKTGPYNFGWPSTRPDWVEHFSYNPGLVIWKWDTSQADNNTTAHPGEGLILPVDAHPKAEKWADGTLMRNRVQPYDAAFSWYPSAGFTLHKDGVATKIKAKLGVPIFDDHRNTYYDPANPTGSVKITDTNTTISILSQPLSGSTITVHVDRATLKK